MKKKIKRVIRVIDAKIFDGKIYNIYMSHKDNKKKAFFGRKKAVVVCEPVTDMILMQYNKNDYMQYQFYDLAVRFLAIDQYYGKNNIGYALYKKMHTLGGNYGQNNFAEEYYEKMRKKKKLSKYGLVKEEHSIEQFKALIESYEQKGYDETSVVMADRNLLNMNGSHRTSLAVYRNQEFINVEVYNNQFKRRYTIDWFWQVGFSKEEVGIIEETTNKIIKKCIEKLGSFYCILYPPAYEYFDEIMDDIKHFDHGNISVVDYKDMLINEWEFIGLIRTIYSFDSILPRNFKRKLFYILNSSAFIEDKLPVRIIKINIKSPVYRLKEDNGLPESLNTVRLKEAIRARYKGRDEKFTKHYVGDYAHDVIIHSTDNYLSNKAVRILLNIDRNISELFEKLRKYEYCILETSIDKLSPDFPRNFYLNDDIDFFVKECDLKAISETIEQYCKEKFSAEWLHVENIESENGRRVKVLLRDCLIVMFDLMCRMPGIKNEYIEEAISRCIIDNYKHLMMNDEITIRLCKYIENPKKTWHLEYIRANIHNYDFNACAFDNPIKAKKIYDTI